MRWRRSESSLQGGRPFPSLALCRLSGWRKMGWGGVVERARDASTLGRLKGSTRPLPGSAPHDRHRPWMSCSPQSMQYLFWLRRLFACPSSLHSLMGTFAFTTPPHIGQKRTGAFERLCLRLGQLLSGIVMFPPLVRNYELSKSSAILSRSPCSSNRARPAYQSTVSASASFCTPRSINASVMR